MGIAKSAESVKSVIFGEATAPSESQSKLAFTDGELAYNEVPVDMFRYFDRELGNTSETELKRMRDINSGIKGDTTGSKMAELTRLERKLGVPHFSESRINRVWNYLKISKSIEGLEAQRDALIGDVRT